MTPSRRPFANAAKTVGNDSSIMSEGVRFVAASLPPVNSDGLPTAREDGDRCRQVVVVANRMEVLYSLGINSRK